MIGGSNLENTVLFGENRKAKSEFYGISQNKLALDIEISREYLNNIEKFTPEQPFDMIIDYVRVRFPTLNAKHVVEEILGLKFMRIMDFIHILNITIIVMF